MRKNMIKIFVLMLFSFTLITCLQSQKSPEQKSNPSAQGTSEIETEEQRILAKYSLEELDQVAHYGSSMLIEDVEARSAKRKAKSFLKCDPSLENSNILAMQAKALIDIKITSESLAYLKRPLPERIKDSKYLSCSKNCHCGVYAKLLEKIGPGSLQPEELDLLQFLKKEHVSVSDKHAHSCLKNVKWFCDSDLKKFLEKQANTAF